MTQLKLLFNFLILISPLLIDFWKFHVKDSQNDEPFSPDAFKESINKVSQKWTNILSKSLSQDNLSITVMAIFIAILFFSPYLYLMSYITDSILLNPSENSIFPDSLIGQSFFSLFGAKVISYAKKSLINVWSKQAIFIRHIGHHSRKGLVLFIGILMATFFVSVLLLDSNNSSSKDGMIIFFALSVPIISYITLTVTSVLNAYKASNSIRYIHKVTDSSAKKQIELAYNELFVTFNENNPYLLEHKKTRVRLRDSWLKFEYVLDFHKQDNKLYTWGSNHIINDTFSTLQELGVEFETEANRTPEHLSHSEAALDDFNDIENHTDNLPYKIVRPSLIHIPIITGTFFGVFFSTFLYFTDDYMRFDRAFIIALVSGFFFGVSMLVAAKINIKNNSILPYDLKDQGILFGGFASLDNKVMGSLWVTPTHIYFKGKNFESLEINRSPTDLVVETGHLPFIRTFLTIINNDTSYKFAVIRTEPWLQLFEEHPCETTDKI